MKKNKDFDCVEMKREIQSRLTAAKGDENAVGKPLHIASLPKELQEFMKKVSRFEDRLGKKAS